MACLLIHKIFENAWLLMLCIAKYTTLSFRRNSRYLFSYTHFFPPLRDTHTKDPFSWFSYNYLLLLSPLMFSMSRAHLSCFHSCKLTSNHQKFNCKSSTLLLSARINSFQHLNQTHSHTQNTDTWPCTFYNLSLRYPLP